MAATTLAKLSSVRTMSAVCLATSVPVMPIATPIFARFSAGASLTPSPVIATTWPRDFERIDDSCLVLGRDPAANVELVDFGRQLAVAQLFEFRAGEHQTARGEQADVPRDGLGGILVIAGHHDALQPGAGATFSASTTSGRGGSIIRAARRR